MYQSKFILNSLQASFYFTQSRSMLSLLLFSQGQKASGHKDFASALSS